MGVFAFGAIIALNSCKSTPEVTDDFKIETTSTVPVTSIGLYTYENGEFSKVDSVQVVDGKCVLVGKTSEPQMMYLGLDDARKIGYFVEAGNFALKINGKSKDSIEFTGSKSQDEFNLFNDKVGEFDDALGVLGQEYRKVQESGDTAALKVVNDKYEEKYEGKNEFIAKYVKDNSKKVTTPYIITRYMMYDKTGEEMQAMLDALDPSLQTGKYGKVIADRVVDLNKTKIGNKMPDFGLNDKDGKEIRISDFKGQYVLIDFWASWCGPCRAENPNVVAAYNEHKDDNFTILGVSLDQDKDKWLAAIEKDQLTWSHISDLKGWNNAMAEEFGVKSIPFSVLLDPNGIVLKKNLREEELRSFLDETLKK